MQREKRGNSIPRHVSMRRARQSKEPPHRDHKLTPKSRANKTGKAKFNSKGQLLNHILGGDTPTVTKVAMECLNEMMKDRTRQT